MNIVSADVHRLELPLANKYSSVYHPDLDTTESTLVVLSAGDGTHGIGTADAVTGYSKDTHDTIESNLVTELLPGLLEGSFEHPNHLVQFFDTIDGAANAKCAVEMAVLDLYCKTRGISIGEFLGGPLVDALPLNGSVSLDTPAAMADEASDWRRRGFTSLKLKLDGDAETDIARVAAVCEAVGEDMEVRADANCSYDVETAIEVAKSLERYPLAHFEQPIPLDDIDGLAALTHSTETPIMADECLTDLDRVREVLVKEAADRLKVKILRLGGILSTRQALDIAALHGITCVVGHGVSTTPGAYAELQFAATHRNVFGAVEMIGPLRMADEPFVPRFQAENGRATLPTSAGVGVELDDDLDEFSIRSQTLS